MIESKQVLKHRDKSDYEKKLLQRLKQIRVIDDELLICALQQVFGSEDKR